MRLHKKSIFYTKKDVSYNYHHMEHGEKKKDYLLPGSILFSALLISFALFYSAGKQATQNVIVPNEQQNETLSAASLAKNVNPISSSDHTLGPSTAPLKIIVFSDPECPYCKDHHFMLKEVMNKMPGKIQIVLRNFPLSGHTQSKQEIVASECVADLRGNDAFWKYMDNIFESTPSNDGLDLSLLPQFATALGIERKKFEECVQSGKFDAAIEQTVQNAKESGLTGTPYSILIAPNGQYIPLGGYFPIEEFQSIVEQALKQA